MTALELITWLRDFISDPRRGLERFANKYYGIYPARVIDNKDPENRGRVRAVCPAINMADEGDVPESFWMLPSMNGLGNTASGSMSGVFVPPDIGVNIWVSFQYGDVDYPVYIGGFVTAKNEDNDFDGVDKRGIKTKSGHYLLFDDTADDLRLIIGKGKGDGSVSTQELKFDKNGTLLTTEKGSKVFMASDKPDIEIVAVDDKGVERSSCVLSDDSVKTSTGSGGSIELKGRNVTISGDLINIKGKILKVDTDRSFLVKNASEPAIRGNKFVTGWSIMHQHTTTAPGSPTTTGVTPPPLITKELSDKVFIG